MALEAVLPASSNSFCELHLSTNENLTLLTPFKFYIAPHFHTVQSSQG